MAPTCPHGYPPQTCLICQTLGTAPRGGRTAERARDGDSGGRHWFGPRGAQAPAPVQAPAGSRLGVRPSLLLIILAVIAVLGVVWSVAGLVFAILRLVELFAAIVVAGWVGYRVGVARGRRGG